MSLLSVRRAKTSPAKYIPNIAHTVARTTKFLLSPSRVNSVKTFLKSMGLGEAKMFPPNAERCVHKQCRFPLRFFHPTLKKKKKQEKCLKRKCICSAKACLRETRCYLLAPFPHRRDKPGNFRSENIHHLKIVFISLQCYALMTSAVVCPHACF